MVLGFENSHDEISAAYLNTLLTVQGGAGCQNTSRKMVVPEDTLRGTPVHVVFIDAHELVLYYYYI